MPAFTCPHCHSEVASDAFSCPFCGASLSGELEYVEYEDGYAVLRPKRKSIRLCKIEPKHLGKPVLAVLDSAFQGCEKLYSVLIPSSIRRIGNRAFEGCRRISTLLLPESIVEIGEYAFSGCSSIDSLSLGNGIATVKQNAVCTCQNIAAMRYSGGFGASLSLASSCVCGAFTFSNSLIKVGRCAFAGCLKIKDLYIPEGVKEIGFGAFRGCKKLESASIPMSMIRMEDPFIDCPKLKTIRYNGTKEAWRDIYLAQGEPMPKATLICVDGVDVL